MVSLKIVNRLNIVMKLGVCLEVTNMRVSFQKTERIFLGLCET
jgi:hypothetical protein